MGQAHRFHPTILREYDIRGIVGETLGPDDARAIGRAYGTMLKERGGARVCVGRDGRLSSPELAEALIQGLVGTGLAVQAVGLGPTPMLYFAVHHLDADGGIQVTGSHNPPSHNGFKMMLGKGSLYGDAIQRLGALAASGRMAQGAGRVEQVDVFGAYVDRLAGDFTGSRAVDAVWDAGNGAAGPAMLALAARLPGRHECLFAEVDGRFPNHHPDPTVPENLVDLIREVTAGGFEAGIGFDGDGDRIGVVDGKGRIVWGDQILLILAGEILRRLPGSTIISDVKASQILFDEIGRLGGVPLMWKTGHSLIKAKMAEIGSPLSGEMSGHIFYKDRFYGHDDALYVAVRLLSILAGGDRTLADLRDAMPPSFTTPEVRFDCDEAVKFKAIEQVKANLEAAGADFDGIDGVRVLEPDGWWLLRASNTQAVIVARCESRSDEGLGRLKERVRFELRRVGVEPPAGF
ncbi:MAG TPA: phosphomannomutase/phosphoglucomutase [Geminicoccaceae bacterium]|nr:phosphomannomutase/phosphoglucomutase [Geminicoccus sp.]HMU48290.1 phosphomannomutase/phosphoglucomutase [Geminicoccaceae bacterium]